MTFSKIYRQHSMSLGVFALVLFVFGTSFYSGPLWDDYVFLFKNEQITKSINPFSFFNPFSQNHRAWPMGYTFFWILYKVFGENWVLYKLLNILIHTFNSLLVWKFFKRENIKFPFITAIIFAVHPLHMETVSWIFQLNTMLATTMLLISIGVWQKYIEARSNKAYSISLLFFTFSLLIKSYAIFMPFLYLYQLRGLGRKKYTLIIPFFLISTLIGLNTLRGVNSSVLEAKNQSDFHTKGVVENKNLIFEVPTVEELNKKTNEKQKLANQTTVIKIETSPPHQLDLADKPIKQENPFAFGEYTQKLSKLIKLGVNRYIFIANNFGFYLRSSFALSDRVLFHPPVPSDSSLKIFINLVFFTSFLIFFSMCFLKGNQKIKGVNRNLLLMLALGFIPISGVFYVPFMKFSPVSDHWAYLLLIPCSGFLVNLMHSLYAKLRLNRYFSTFYYIAAIPLFIFTIESLNYGVVFNNHEKLFLKNIDLFPQNVFLYRYLAKDYLKAGDINSASNVLKRGRHLHPYDMGLILDEQTLSEQN